MKNLINILIILAIIFTFSSCTRDKNAVASIDIEVIEEEIEVVPPVVMVTYEEPVLNIFFHPLVARPEQAFRSTRYRDFFLEWYVTASEYRNFLYEMYINDWVLVDINELYEVTNIDGVKRVNYIKPLIPEGKRPMILSIDDLNYYDFVRENASVHKLVIDENNLIAGWTPGENGDELSYDLDVVTYTEVFLKQYPDFAVRGARGIIALTGYEGVLGYKTHLLNAPEYQQEKEEAMKVVKRLKELGWRFASHSWGHANMPDVPMERFTRDTNRWDAEVRPVIGDTDLFIYPFGARVEDIPERHRILRNHGFNVFFGVGLGFTTRERQTHLYMDRRNVDGNHFRTFRNRDDKVFDFDKVIDVEARSIR